MPVQPGFLDPLTQTSFDNSQAGISQPQNPVWIVGQALNAQPFAPYPCFSPAQADNFAGAGSHLARMFRAYFANDPVGPIYLLPYADAAGATPAGCSVVFNGTASANGTVNLYIAGQYVPVGVSAGMSSVQIAAAVVAAVNASQQLPVTATAVAAVDTTLRKVQLTARNAGTLGNWINVQMNLLGAMAGQATPAGISTLIGTMNGGATDPDLTQVAAVLGDTSMRLLIHPYSRNATAMAAFAALMNDSTGRWGALRGSMGHCFTAAQDTVATLQTYGGTNDDQHSSVLAYETGSPTPIWEAAAIWAGSQAASLRTQPNAPTTGLPMLGFMPPPAGLAEASGGAFLKTTRNNLLGNGLGTARYPVSGPVVNRAPTTYQTNAFGQPDESYFDTQQMFNLMRIKDFISEWETDTFRQTLVADNGTKMAQGIKYTTPQLFMAGMADLYLQLQTLGLVEDASAFIAASSAVRNLTSPGEIDAVWGAFLVSGLYQVTNNIQFRNYSALAAAAAAGAASAGLSYTAA